MMGLGGRGGGDRNLIASQGCILGIVIAAFIGLVWLMVKVVRWVIREAMTLGSALGK